HGQPIRFGTDRAKGVIRNERTGDLEVVTVTPDNETRILVHDAHAPTPTTAFALSRLADPDTLHHTPIGVFRNTRRPVYDTLMAEQLDAAVDRYGKADLGALLTGTDAWTVAG
ncbi:2-oxoacid:ferredoxin oxidoreductase subunit beta, partial [Streptomyces sp. NPDC001389]